MSTVLPGVPTRTVGLALEGTARMYVRACCRTESLMAAETAVQATRNSQTSTTTASYACSCALAMADYASGPEMRRLGLPYDVPGRTREEVAACSLRDDQRAVSLLPHDPGPPTSWAETFDPTSCGATGDGVARSRQPFRPGDGYSRQQ